MEGYAEVHQPSKPVSGREGVPREVRFLCSTAGLAPPPGNEGVENQPESGRTSPEILTKKRPARAPVQVLRTPEHLATIRELVERASSPEPTTGCWLWLGEVNSEGYGRLWLGVQRQRTQAHRASYEAFRGEILPGLTIDHLCRVRCCVNPAHLEPVTQRTNTLRGTSEIAQNARKATCSRGHELVGENLYVGADGHRRCRACTALKSREHYERNREEIIARVTRRAAGGAR